MERIKQWWKFLMALAALTGNLLVIWNCLSAAGKVVGVGTLLAAVIVGAWWASDLLKAKEKAVGDATTKVDEVVSAATVLLEAMGARVVDGRIEPNEHGAQFSADAREHAATLYALIVQRKPALLARLDPEQPPVGILERSATTSEKR